jgi:hypothetical protein
MAQVSSRYTEYADALIERFEECGVLITDRSRLLIRGTVSAWLEDLLRCHDAGKRAFRTQASASCPGLVAEAPGEVLKSGRQSFLQWIVQWIFSIGFKLVGLFALWTFSLHFDEEPTLELKK